MSRRALSFAIKLFDILLQVSKHGDLWNASQMVELQTDHSFHLSILMRYIKSVLISKDVTFRKTRELVEDDGFYTVLT